MRYLYHILLLSLLLTACTDMPETLTADKRAELEEAVLPSFQLADGLRIDLFAAEPLVKDPVAMEIDEQGNLYVVEMPGYPLDVERSGRIVRLIDTDADGFPDQRQLFAEELMLPTGIMRWKKGFIVTDAPDVLYLEDTDGDGRADKREVLLTGFALSNPQHNLNTPLYGLDNWIYLAHEYFITTQTYKDIFGDEGSEIHFPDKPEAVRLPANANDLSVRFRPEQYEAELLSSNTQYGHTFSPWGHYFQTSNANHLYHEVIQAPYLARKPHLLVADAMQYLPDYGRGVEVFAITQNPEHQLLTDVGTITSACGIHWYTGGTFPKMYNDIIFTCEPTHNLIHADRLSPKGASFTASRLWDEQEFLASTDAWFRPVQTYIGPDGALYVLDYYRQIIEHPEWMDESINESGQLYNGTDQGRIYRIAPEDAAAATWLQNLDLHKQSTETLVQLLAHPNSWQRRTAQRLLVTQQDSTAIPPLKKLATQDDQPLGQLHALWALEGLAATQGDLLRQALQAPQAGLRENAIKLIELHLPEHPEWADWLYPLAADTDARVRFQLLCTLGEIDTPEARQQANAILQQDMADEWVHLAALSSPFVDEAKLLTATIAQLDAMPKPGEPEFLGALAAATCLEKPQQIEPLIAKATQLNPATAWWRTALLQGILRVVPALRQNTFSDESRRLLTKDLLQDETLVRQARLQLLEQIGVPSTFALSQPQQTDSPEQEADAVRLTAIAKADENQAWFQSLLQPSKPIVVQEAAISGLGRDKTTTGCSFIISKWEQLTPELRDIAIDQLMQSSERMHLLLDAVTDGDIDPGTIGWRRTVHLMNNDDPDVKQHARDVLAHQNENREEVVADYLPALQMPGKIAEGAAVFEQHCALCHTYKGENGIAYGPDLASVRNRTATSILTDILIPNRAIADGYEVWLVEQQNGTTLSGIITSETATTLTLRDATGKDTVVPRSSITSLKAMSASGMPDGLEQQLSLADMANLLAFIRQVETAELLQ